MLASIRMLVLAVGEQGSPFGTFVVMTWAAGSLGEALAIGESGNLLSPARINEPTQSLCI